MRRHPSAAGAVWRVRFRRLRLCRYRNADERPGPFGAGILRRPRRRGHGRRRQHLGLDHRRGRAAARCRSCRRARRSRICSRNSSTAAVRAARAAQRRDARHARSAAPTRSAPASSSTRPGIVVTNNHVIGDANEIFVIFSDGTRLKAEVVGKDSKVDLAVLRVKPDKPLKVGQVRRLRQACVRATG